MKKNKFLFIIILLFIGIINVKAFDNSIKVYDYAYKLTTEEEEKLKEKINQYINEFNMDMAIVTVNYHEKNSTMEYADDFYDYNGFGIGDDRDGLIFVLDFKIGEFYISTSGAAINMYNDARINSMLDSIERYKGNYYKMFDEFIDTAYNFAESGLPQVNSNSSINEPTNSVKILPIFPIIITDSIITLIIMLILINKNKMIKKSVNANYYIDKKDFKITKKSDVFLTTHTTSVRINTQATSSGGGGGSSIHHSSSGRIHGGGGRKL